LLHHPGRAAGWGNLGLWAPLAHDGRDYCSANEQLANALAKAAGLQPGESVLSLACGAGAELLHWRHRFQAGAVTGVALDARPAQQRCAHEPQVTVIAASALALVPRAERVDVVLCLDAAYHLSPRAAFLRVAFDALKPGGRLAFCDLVWDGAAPPPAMRAAAKLCGIDACELRSVADQQARLRDAGFEPTPATRLDDEVLGGFARFVAAQSRQLGRAAWHFGWWRPAITARLIAPCRRLGVGYAIYAASKSRLHASATGTGPM
jgi:SAM-dependent methyltransferase